MRSLPPLLFASSLLLLGGCDPENPDSAALVEPDAEPERGHTGKGDAPGSCQPSDCGGPASIGSCWCDELCTQYGDCCTDKAAVCDGAGPEPQPQPQPQPEPSEPSGDWSFDDVHGVPNLDDDDGQNTDFNQYLFAGDDDLSQVVVPASGFAPGDFVRMQLQGDVGAIRVWHDGEPALGSAANAGSYAFEPAGGEEILTIEFGDYGAGGLLTLEHVSGQNEVLASDTIELQASPLIMNHHLQPSEAVMATRVSAPGYDNGAFIAAYQNTLGDQFFAAPGSSYGNDVWIQDEFEFATALGDQGQRLDVVIDSVRDRGLDDFAEDALVGPSFIAQSWGNPWQATTFDSFGNLEASPPVVVDGVEYPFGRIYYGRAQGQGMNLQLASFLAQQSVQAPFELDTRWLCVGHVDEYSSFVPDPSSPKGFKLLLADVNAGLDLLQSLPAGMSIPRYGADHGYGSVGEILSDDALIALNLDIQQDRLDVIRQQFKDNLGLTEADIIDVPSVFEYLGGCGAAALVPAMVNLIVADSGGQTHLFVPDPFFRANPGSQGSDPFIQAFAESMPAGLQLHFVDNWDVYHLGIGEVHCGTNVIRTPTQDWWATADHLLGGQ